MPTTEEHLEVRNDTMLDGLTGASETTQADVIARNHEVRAAAGALRAAIDGLHQSEDSAWKRYAHDVDGALVHLDSELQIAAAQLRAERAESRADLDHAVHQAGAAWKGATDDARVQARLARMEAEDAGRRSLVELAHAASELEVFGRGLRADLETAVGETRTGATNVIGHLRGALREIFVPLAPGPGASEPVPIDETAPEEEA